MSIAATEINDLPIYADPRELRRAARSGAYDTHVIGQVPGYVHTNLCIVPEAYAFEFLSFCQRNPKPCPLLGMSAPGDPRLPTLGEDLDVRTDAPQYRIFRDGRMVEDVTDITDLWQDDFVAFALGCSLSFEEPLLEAGLPLRHVKARADVPIYLTDIDCEPAGRFAGKMVVSMRPFRPADAIRAIQITSRLPNVHGAPVHIGLPEAIGIDDISVAWQCGTPDVRPGEIPVFWACGVTPQVVVEAAKPPICITHRPSHMLVTDLKNAALSIL
jgi:uncharacterized protein YcsI (UPF0317 family)